MGGGGRGKCSNVGKLKQFSEVVGCQCSQPVHLPGVQLLFPYSNFGVNIIVITY